MGVGAFCHVVGLGLGVWQVHGAQAQVVVDAYAAAVWYAQRSNPPLPRNHHLLNSTQLNPHPIINIFREYRFVFFFGAY